MNTYEKRVKIVENYIDRIDLKQEILNYYEGRSVLVTGGAGAIGSNLIIALSKLVGKAGKVIVLDNLSAIKSKDPFNVTPLPNIMFVLGDVRSDVDLKRVFKVTGEMYCNFYHHHYGLPIVNCRFFNSYGPGEVPGQYRNVIPNFIYWAMKGIALPITGTGEETRDFTYVLDLVQGLIKAGYYKEAVGENFNLASGKEVRIRDLAEMVNKATENRKPIYFMERRKWDTKARLLASIEKAERLVGYRPFVDFEEGFRSNIEWFKDNWKKIEALADFPPGMSSAVRGAESIC
jgi:nucleoside-diphosphate-sugar epimerase